MRAILSLFLALCLLLSPAAGCFAAAEDGVDWAEMPYTHYDASALFQGAERLTALSDLGDGQAAIALYDQLYDQFAQLDALSAIAYVNSSADLTDEYWSGESQYSDNLRYDAADALCTACHALACGSCAEEFAAHVGQSAFDAFVEYVPLTDRESELLARETELVDQYHVLMNGASQMPYDYLGESWTFDKLNGLEGYSLASQDYGAYLEVYRGLQQAVTQQVGPIFLELVQLRTEMAGIESWDSYAAMAYEEIYGRDYTPEQAQTFCDAVKEVSRLYNDRLYSSSLWYDTEAVLPALAPEDALRLVGEYTARLDPSLVEPFQYLTEHGLYDIAGGPDRFPGSYTITLGQYDSAFIFANPGSSYDGLSTLSHEFGHFVNDYYAPIGNLLTDVPCYDLLEIHSTGLDTLMTSFYGEIFTQGADTARFNTLAALVSALVDGCIYDEFQRRVYAQPDMTLDEMNRLFASISMEYGRSEMWEDDNTWIYVSHTFENPLYYLSYAASSLAAIQLWDMAQTDLQAAVDTWKAVMSHDPSTEGYMTVLPACGLRLFTEPGAVEQICQPLLEALLQMSEEG